MSGEAKHTPKGEDIMVERIEFTKERGLEMQLKHPSVHAMCQEWARWFKESGGENYVELSLYHADIGFFNITMQRAGCITPGAKASALERLNAELLEALESFAAQHKCGCGHPHCNRCADDAMASEVISKAKGQP